MNTEELHRRQTNIVKSLVNYSEAYAVDLYSIEHFCIINNITDDEYEWLEKFYDRYINIINTKYRHNLKVRLMNPDIKASEVTAIKLLLDENKEDNNIETDNNISITLVSNINNEENE